LAPSQNIFVPPEHLGAGVNGEEGTNQESVTALLVMAGGGASCNSGGGELHVMAVIFVFFSVARHRFLRKMEGKIRKRAKL